MTSIIVKPIQKQRVRFKDLNVGDVFKLHNNYYMKILYGCFENAYFNSMLISNEEYMYFNDKHFYFKDDDIVEPIKSELIIYDDDGVVY